MHKVDFIFSVVEAGYSNEQCTKIEEILDSYAERSHFPKQTIRDAAIQYLMICRDIDKLGGFLQLSEEMNRQFAVSWEQAYEFVLGAVCGWCK